MDGIETHDPAFLGMVLPNAPLVMLGTGFAWLEGPVWFADHDCLLVSDLPNDRVLRCTPVRAMLARRWRRSGV